jgi:hypothetical protein
MSISSDRTISPPNHMIQDVAIAASDLQRLLVLDRIWTGAENNSSTFTDRDREALFTLGRCLDLELALAERHGGTLGQFFDSYGGWVNQRITQELSESRVIGPEHRDGIRRVLGVSNEDFAARGGAAARSVMRMAQAERTALREKVEPLRGNGPVVTDISQEAWCSIAAGGLVADLAVCPETLGVGCAAAVAIYFMMDSAGC